MGRAHASRPHGPCSCTPNPHPTPSSPPSCPRCAPPRPAQRRRPRPRGRSLERRPVAPPSLLSDKSKTSRDEPLPRSQRDRSVYWSVAPIGGGGGDFLSAGRSGLGQAGQGSLADGWVWDDDRIRSVPPRPGHGRNGPWASSSSRSRCPPRSPGPGHPSSLSPALALISPSSTLHRPPKSASDALFWPAAGLAGSGTSRCGRVRDSL